MHRTHALPVRILHRLHPHRSADQRGWHAGQSQKKPGRLPHGRKYLAIIQPFSALLANAKFRSEHSKSCLGVEDIAQVIRSASHWSRASACFHCTFLAHAMNWQTWQTNGRIARLLHVSQGSLLPALQVWRVPLCIAVPRTASNFNPIFAPPKHANWRMCAWCPTALTVVQKVPIQGLNRNHALHLLQFCGKGR